MKRALLVGVLAVAFVLCGSQAFATPILWSANGHYYDLIDFGAYSGNWQSWVYSDNHASAQQILIGSSYYNGYLATITSSDENTFINGFLHTLDSYFDAFIGGFQPGSSEDEPDIYAGWTWVTGEAWAYANWGTHINNSGDYGHQDAAEFEVGGATWNDLHSLYELRRGYIIEYESVIPEPATMTLLGLGLFGLLGLKRKKA